MESMGAIWLNEDYRPPDTLYEAVAAARILSKGIDYARFDFFSIDGELFAGEITVYPNAGLVRANDNPDTNIDALTNLRWDLRKSDFMTSPREGRLIAYRALLDRCWRDRL
jgi:hypothetical protein